MAFIWSGWSVWGNWCPNPSGAAAGAEGVPARKGPRDRALVGKEACSLLSPVASPSPTGRMGCGRSNALLANWKHRDGRGKAVCPLLVFARPAGHVSKMVFRRLATPFQVLSRERPAFPGIPFVLLVVLDRRPQRHPFSEAWEAARGPRGFLPCCPRVLSSWAGFLLPFTSQRPHRLVFCVMACFYLWEGGPGRNRASLPLSQNH